MLAAANAISIATIYYYERYISKTPCHDSLLSGHVYIREILDGHDRRCQESFRMDKYVFKKLCDILSDEGLLRPTRFTTIEEQLAIFLLTIGRNERNRTIQERFQHSDETISRHFNKVLDGIIALSPKIFTPATPNVPEEIIHNPRFYPYFKDFIGAIDGTHIPAMVGVEEHGAFRNRKGFISQNVLAACSFDMQFQYVLAGWEGSNSDSRILESAINRQNKLEVPEGKYYLIDAGFVNTPKFLAPYRGVRYHLSKFQGGNNPVNAKEMFNHRHSSLRNVIKHTFGVLKARFPILTTAPPYPFETQVKIVIACCIIHNHIRRENKKDWIFNRASQQDWGRHHGEIPEVDMQDESETNSQMRRCEIASGMRRLIANSMWEQQSNI